MSKLAVAVAVALASSRVYALGLGEINLHSALNEPLKADVRLLAAKPGELDDATVRLAPEAEFKQAGIERPAILSDINFNIVSGKDGTATLKITSTKPIREPFLDFIVQLNWQAGRLMREYTVLLDPPVFSEDKKAPVAAPAAQAATSTQQPAPAAAAVPTAPTPMASAGPQTPAPTAVSSPAPQSAAVGSVNAHKPKLKLEKGHMTYGPVQRTDTLWSIANSLRPDDSVSVYQMMLALVKENPQAFYDNNVNGLKAGYVLRLPDKSVALSIDEAQAVRETERQYQQWRQAHGGAPMTTGGGSAVPAKGSGSAASPSGAAGKEKEGARLRLVAPGDVSAKGAGAGGNVQKDLDKLRGELAIAMESSDTAKRESDELRSRVATLENQITSMQKLLTLKDQALNDLQKRSGMTANPPKEQTSAPQMVVPSVAPAKPATAKPAPVKPAAPKKQQASDIFSDTTLMAEIAGAVVLLLAVLWLIVRRRRNEGPVEGDEAMEATPVEDTPPVEEEAMPSSVEEELGATQQMDDVAEEVAQDAEEDIPQTADDLEMLHTPEGDIDPIVEADVYLAYRRYQQAEALIQNALTQQPDRQDLQAKLLEIYYAAKNADAFQNVAESLYTNLGKNPDSDVWQRVLPMGRELCPEHPLFNPSAETGDGGVSEDIALSNASDSTASGMESVDTGTGMASESGEESFDLDLGGGQTADVELTTENESAVDAAQQEDKMEFDLNLGGESDALAEQAPAEETTESLGAALDFADQAPVTEETESKAAEAATPPAGAESQGDSWEIEPAMSEFGNIDFGLDDSDLLAGTDVVGTKLDLARAYIDMGDNDSARDILTEVIEEGSPTQKQEAQGLVEKIA